jgi:uncharacterized membrane protein YbhN (UPF0104 family)
MLGGALVLAALIWRVGTGPFLAGLHTVDLGSLAAAIGIAAVTTVCCAMRWNLVARGLGVGLPLRAAVGAYYRSQFLNATLPGGVLGDLHRGVRHGRDVGDLSRGLRAVACERCAGQVVQVLLATVVLLALPSPVQSSMPLVLTAVGAAVFFVLGVSLALPGGGSSRLARSLRALCADIRDGLLARRAWPGVVLTSGIAVAGHAATFLLAAWTAGSTASPMRLLPLALLVMVASGLPINVGGWGPREGITASAFGMAGLGVHQGITTAVAYGVMVFVASLPGAVVLAAACLRRRSTARLGRPATPDSRSSETGLSIGAVTDEPGGADRPFDLMSSVPSGTV